MYKGILYSSQAKLIQVFGNWTFWFLGIHVLLKIHIFPPQIRDCHYLSYQNVLVQHFDIKMDYKHPKLLKNNASHLLRQEQIGLLSILKKNWVEGPILQT